MLYGPVFIGLICLSPSSAGAAVTFSAPSRSISAVASNIAGQIPPPGESRAWQDFGYHNESVEQSVQTINEAPGVMQRALARQESFIGSNWVAFNGVTSFAENAFSSGSGYCIARSSAAVTIQLTEPTPWVLTVSTFGPGAGGNQTFPSAAIQDLATSQFVLLNSFSSASGVLGAGTYRLSLSISAGHSGSGTASGTINYASRLDIPAPGAATVLALGIGLGMRRRR